MKIGDIRAAQIAQAYGPQNAGPAKPKRLGQRADEASLSSEARALLAARRAAHDAPEVRAERIAELRRQVQSGTYQVDAATLAAKLLKILREE
ncbi:MAG: flagellar biosynthesis anti-sigma factor FlgM [Chloroflexi bacterium]|nr:flagellar biosynthesis anti-sigma factor FlgM [Chloroflexota bacterium]